MSMILYTMAQLGILAAIQTTITAIVVVLVLMFIVNRLR